MQILQRILRKLLQLPADIMVVSSGRLPRLIRSVARDSVSISAKCYPYFDENEEVWVIPKTPAQSDVVGADDSGLPVPPDGILRGGAEGGSVESYLSAGREHVETMRRIAETDGFCLAEGRRILELGCAGGRLIRWFSDLAGKVEIWGTEVSQECVVWCQQHLSPPFKFFTTTSLPHLPFEDESFDFIYAGSVFTHIPILADTWILELRRILRPGGRLYITVHDRHTMALSSAARREGRAPKFGEEICRHETSGFGALIVASWGYQEGFDSQVFYDVDFICGQWGRFLDVLSVTPEAYADQTAILFGK